MATLWVIYVHTEVLVVPAVGVWSNSKYPDFLSKGLHLLEISAMIRGVGQIINKWGL